MSATKEEIIAKLRSDMVAWEGFRPASADAAKSFGLGSIENAFPNGVFPTGVVHEFLTCGPEETSATAGMITGIIKSMLQNGGTCVWVSYSRRIYPPALKMFGVDPDKIVFVDVSLQGDVLWVTDEALKCEGVTAVVCETRELTFMESRRLQLAVEQSNATGFIIRKDVKKVTANACVARWRVTPLLSQLRAGMPGVGYPRWQVELLKVKNGSPGSWLLEWRRRQFQEVFEQEGFVKQHKYA